MLDSDTYKILHGDALTVLRSLPDESVQCCITSPPYYGLRDYHCEPVLWGNHNGCDHEFGETIKNPKLDTRPIELKIAQGGQVGTNVASQHWSQGNLGNFCLKCNAWRGQLGLEPTFKLYIEHLIEIFAEVKRVLKPTGTCWVNLGDSYAGSSMTGGTASKEGSEKRLSRMFRREMSNTTSRKSLMNIPARFAIAMTDELQFVLRNWLIWHKPACMPSSATDRFTVDFEPIFFFAKSPKYKFNQQLEATAPITPIRLEQNIEKQAGSVIEGGGYHEPIKAVGDPDWRNKRTTWRVNFEPSKENHFASYPTKLVEPMILAGTDEGDTVLDIFNGTATTGVTAIRNRRKYLGIELNEDYIKISEKRLREVQIKLF